MGKKYLDTKKGSLEQSILSVWDEAAKMHEEGFDGRTKDYRQHRAKLEAARVKREEKKNKPKMEQPETEHGSGEHAFEVGTKRFDDYTREITPGQVEEALSQSEEDFDKLLENMTYEELELFEKGVVDFIQKRTGLGFGGKAKRAAHLKKKADKKQASADAAQDIDKAKAKIAAAKKQAKDYKQQKKDAKKQAKAMSKEFNSYEPEAEETISEAASPDWAQPRNLRDTVIAMWTEASSAVNPKDREELDKAPEKTAKKMKRADEPAPNVTEEVEELDEKLTAKQKKIDVDGDGEIEGSDLAKLRKKAKKEGKTELEVAKEFKVASMKEALAKVWGLEEGGMKRMASGHGMKTFKPKPKEKKEGKKADTGEDIAAVELDPKIKDKK